MEGRGVRMQGAGMQIGFRRSRRGVKRCPNDACPWVCACRSESLRKLDRMAYTAHVAKRQAQAGGLEAYQTPVGRQLAGSSEARGPVRPD